MCSVMFLSSTETFVVSDPLGEEVGGSLAKKGRSASARPRYFAKLDFPEPKKPETQTPMPSWGLLGVSA